MKRTVIKLAAAGAVVAVGASPSLAADMDYQQALGLVVSGSYESWVGATVIGSFASVEGLDEPEDDVYFMSGGEARLSFPLGDTLSIQQDVKYELNAEALKADSSANDVVDDFYGYQWQATTHLSFMRDPSTGLFGVFGGFGGGAVDPDPMGAWFVGGEFQYYMGDWTIYGQAGYFDGKETDDDEDNEMFRDAIFGRAVARWYMSPDSRLQFEAAYADGVANFDDGDVTVDDHFLVEWGVRFDTVLHALPVVGDTNVFVRYRGNYVENEDPDAADDATNPEYFSDHTFMVGFHWAFGGNSRQEHERIGVALDSPDIVRWSQSGEIMN